MNEQSVGFESFTLELHQTEDKLSYLCSAYVEKKKFKKNCSNIALHISNNVKQHLQLRWLAWARENRFRINYMVSNTALQCCELCEIESK